MYELMILVQLIRHPAHGYLIAKILNDIMGPYMKVSNGRLYPLLARLEQDGLIVVDDEQAGKGDRQLRAYHITEKGRKRFYTLMMDVSSHQGDYRAVFLQKIVAIDWIELPDRIKLLDHYLNYCQMHIQHATDEADDLQKWQNEPFIGSLTIQMLRHTAAQWELEFQWTSEIKELIIRRAAIEKK